MLLGREKAGLVSTKQEEAAFIKLLGGLK